MEKTIKILIILTLMITISLPQIHAATGIQIVSSTGYIDTVGYYNVVGEVLNRGNQTLEDVEISATFYNQSNVVVGASNSFTMLEYLLPGSKSPFIITLTHTGQSGKVHHYSLTAEYSTSAAIVQALQFNSNSSYTDGTGIFHVIGEIKNIAASDTTDVRVIATYYNGTGGVVAAAATFTNPSTISSNGTAPFNIMLSSDRAVLVHHYALTSDSDQYAVVPEFNTINLAVTIAPLTIMMALVWKKLRKSTS